MCLCSSLGYLDVEKTLQWNGQLVRVGWLNGWMENTDGSLMEQTTNTKLRIHRIKLNKFLLSGLFEWQDGWCCRRLRSQCSIDKHYDCAGGGGYVLGRHRRSRRNYWQRSFPPNTTIATSHRHCCNLVYRTYSRAWSVPGTWYQASRMDAPICCARARV